MILLGVNIDHVATIRQARYRDEDVTFGNFIEPDPVEMAWLAEDAGADGITMHIREDRRHIQVDDVHRYREKMKTRLNLETSMSLEMIQLAQEIAPESVCLVPENRKEVTTEGGLDVRGNIERASEVVRELLQSGIPVSMFIDPDLDQLNACAEIGAPWVELHTGSFARSWYDQEKREVELSILREGMRIGSELGLRVNAGHGINYENVNGARTLELIHEFNIGHSIISRSIRTGLEESVQKMRALLNE
jgi:pyridoxine 5-phosphate synthase